MQEQIIEKIKKIRSKIRHLLIGHLSYEHLDLLKEIDSLKLALGKHEARTLKNVKINSIQDAEFKIFSQFGEDGIIQYIINNFQVNNKKFIEFGVGDYSESNTRFLLQNNNWEGLIINNDDEHINFLNSERGKDILYRHRIKIVKENLNIENVNKVFTSNGFSGKIGLLSIDVDGVDYWLLKAIDVVDPSILIIEYNSTFGDRLEVTVPYKKDFIRTNEHYSNLYFGASLKAMIILANKKGFVFLGCNSAGNNAFFISKSCLKSKKNKLPIAQYEESLFRESHDKSRSLTYIDSHKERLMLIKNLPLYDIRSDKLVKIKDLYKL